MKTITLWSVTTEIRSSPSRADHDARDRTCLGTQSRQYLWPYRAWFHTDLRGLRHGEFRARVLGDAGGGDMPRADNGSTMADDRCGARGVIGLRNLGHGGRAYRGSTFRHARHQRVAGGDRGARGTARQCRNGTVWQGAASPAIRFGRRSLDHRRCRHLSVAGFDSGGRIGIGVAGPSRNAPNRARAETAGGRREPGCCAADEHRRDIADRAHLCGRRASRRDRRHIDRAPIQRCVRHGDVVRHQGFRCGYTRRSHQSLGCRDRRTGLWFGGSLRHDLAWFRQHPDRHLHRRHRGACTGAVRIVRRPDQGARMRIIVIVLAAVLAGGAVAVCLFAPGYYAYLLGTLAITTLVGVGLNVLLGLAGEVSLGQGGFLALGAYGVGILTTKAGLGFWEALPLAVMMVVVISALLSIPALRVPGPYLAMVTIAFGFIVESVSIEWRDLTGGSSGLTGIAAPFNTGGTALLACGFCVLALVAFHTFARSPLGLAMQATASAPAAARSIGISALPVRTVAFVLAASTAGLAGGLQAALTGFIAPSSFPFSQCILFLLVVVLGGAGRTLGPLLGSAIVVLLPELLASLAEYRLLFFGAGLLIVLCVAPGGIAGALAPFAKTR